MADSGACLDALGRGRDFTRFIDDYRLLAPGNASIAANAGYSPIEGRRPALQKLRIQGPQFSLFRLAVGAEHDRERQGADDVAEVSGQLQAVGAGQGDGKRQGAFGKKVAEAIVSCQLIDSLRGRGQCWRDLAWPMRG